MFWLISFREKIFMLINERIYGAFVYFFPVRPIYNIRICWWINSVINSLFCTLMQMNRFKKKEKRLKKEFKAILFSCSPLNTVTNKPFLIPEIKKIREMIFLKKEEFSFIQIIILQLSVLFVHLLKFGINLTSFWHQYFI